MTGPTVIGPRTWRAQYRARVITQRPTADRSTAPMTTAAPMSQLSLADFSPSSVEMVDPETAEKWLGKNTRNRNIKTATLATYVHAMKNGQWQYTGESIKFDAEGRLIDGQHRLKAIIASGVTIPIAVTRGLPPSAQDVMDSGRVRGPEDALAIDGEKNANRLKSVAGLVLAGGDVLPIRITTPDVRRVLAEEPSIRWIVNEVVPSLKITAISPMIVGYTYWRLHKIDPAAAREFFNSLASLTDLPAGSPIVALHKRLVSDVRGTRLGRHYRREAQALIYSAWNAWRKGESRSIIKFSYTNGKLNIPEPK